MTRPTTALLVALTTLAALSALLGGCTGGAPDTATGTAASAGVYVSVGDSYAAGYQPEGFAPDNGFAVQLTRRLQGTPHALTLVNLGCPGATATSVTQDDGCPTAADAPGSRAYPGTTQLGALQQVLREDAGRVSLVTVVLGGNEVLPCLDRDDPSACVRAALPGLRTHLAQVLAVVHREAPHAAVVGLTYPDVYLGLLVTGSTADAARARASVPIFRDLLNPVLKATYASAGASFVDVTALSGAYDPLTPTTTLQGRAVPQSVVTVCSFTHFCESGDVHPDDSGYAWYADRVLEAVPALAPPTTPPAATTPTTGG